MTKFLRSISVVIALLSTAFFAYGGISGSRHDLRSKTWMGINDYGEICVYCHTPHGANTAGSGSKAPLWNRNTPAGPYTIYSSSTLTTAPASTPNGVSLACLSCHDGTIAVDSIINAPGSGTNTGGPWYGNLSAGSHDKLVAPPPNNGVECGVCHNGSVGHNALASYLSTNLSNDHPISMTYPADGTKFKVTPDAGLKLYSSKVECPSCHDVHNGSGFQPFLRVSNASSALCLGCHKK